MEIDDSNFSPQRCDDKLEYEKEIAKEEIKERLGNKAKLTQNDINELVRMLAKEHGLI